MAYRLFLVSILLLHFGLVSAQRIQKSTPAKLSKNQKDYEILGKNAQGIFVHYFGNFEHELELFNNNLRSVLKRPLQLKEKNSRLEEIVLLPSGMLAFYSQVEGSKQYLKVKTINSNLDAASTGMVIDSITKYSFEGFDPFYIKQSTDLSKIASFTIFDEKGNFSVKFKVYNDSLTLLSQGEFNIEQRDMVLKSFKINNNGLILAVVAHLGRGSDPLEYSYDELYTFTYNPETQEVNRKDIPADAGYRFKQIVTEVSNEGSGTYMAACYRSKTDMEEIGLLIVGSKSEDDSSYVTQLPFTKEQMAQTQTRTYEFRDWKEQASTIRPKRIMPRSDGGCILITEGEYRYTRVIRTPPTNIYYYGETFARMYDQNHYFDIMGFSISPTGELDWNSIMPKVQITEGDGGLYSSFMLFESNNLLKFLFNEDIYNNGNFIEYNLNPAGVSKRLSIFNSDKEGISVIPQKGKQISGHQIVLPSEQKRTLQLVLFNF